MASKWFRYGFLLFFLAMFGNMVFQTYLVAEGAANLRVPLIADVQAGHSWSDTK